MAEKEHYEMEDLSPQAIKALRNALSCGNINLNDVLQWDEDMRKKEILAKHKFPVTYGKSDNSWHTYVPDEDKPNKRKSVAKRKREDLEAYLVKFYQEREKSSQKQLETLESFYPVWLQHKSLQTTQNDYIKRIDSDWNKYYAKNPIIKIPLVKLTAGYLDDWRHRAVKELCLTKTQYYNMSIILRQGLQYAFDTQVICSNPFENVRIDAKLFTRPRKKTDKEEVFLYEEQAALEKAAYEEFLKSGCTFSLAIPLAFQLGTRVGECVALKFSDITDENYIHVQRMEVDDYILTEDNRILKKGHKIVEHTKSDAGDREIYLTKKAKEIIRTIYDFNKEHGFPTDGFIFVNENGNAHRHGIDYRLRKCCRMAKIEERSTHKLRKSYASSLIDSGEINIKQIMRLMGHTSAKTTYGNYCFNRKGKTQTQEAIEKALEIHV